ncbi:MAG: MBL fold metallo-hydrolase [Acidobacteriota bacterium]|nr:MBL fold metallo-hydrolase [Acidobacteriota bacterium]
MARTHRIEVASTAGARALLVLAAVACGGADPRSVPEVDSGFARDTRADTGPYILTLGTAQDGGLPHAACSCERCEAARGDAARLRRIASLAVVLPESRESYLIDATPDVREQLHALGGAHDEPRGGVDRSPVDGVLLTHAHLGHYTGLAFFGYEAIHTRGLPVYCTPGLARFLRGNGPWSQLVELGNVALQEIRPGEPLALGAGVAVTAITVPHRDEFSDTVGYELRGPNRRVLYVPDTEPWERWERPIEELLQVVDTAILDGTFFSLDELPGRDVAAIGHPLMISTMDRLEPLVRTGKLRVVFTHLNHSNPALDPESDARREIERRGFFLLEDGQVLPL